MNFKTRCTINPSVVAFILALTLGTAAAHAEDHVVKMKFSGIAGGSAANLGIQNAVTSDYTFSGKGTLGSFDFHSVSASLPSQQQPSACSGAKKIFAEAKAGPGVFRFEDGSLLILTLTEGSDCIDMEAYQALCLRTFRINGGTGRFAHASGTLMFTETLVPVPSDVNGAYPPVIYSATGVVEGTISGVSRDEAQTDWR